MFFNFQNRYKLILKDILLNLICELSNKTLNYRLSYWITHVVHAIRVVNGPTSSGLNPKLIESPKQVQKSPKIKLGLKHIRVF